MDVALFLPCYVDQLAPQVGLATVELLERAGARVHFPEAQTCCGQPMANAGCNADAAPLARRMLDIFEPYEFVVCPSGSCTSMVRNHFPALLPEAERPRLDSLRARTFELCEFLHDVAKVSLRGRFAHRVGLLRSCHGLRELRLGSGSERRVAPFDKMEALLAGLSGLELVAQGRPDECCGFGGSFAVAEEAISCAMGRDRLADHQRGGAEIIVGGDVSCLLHLDGLIRREGRPLRVLHIAQLLAEATA